MSIFIHAYNLLLYQPILNGLMLFYLLTKDLGLAIILLTLIIRIIIYPLSVKALAHQKALAEIQPKVKEIQERYKSDRQKQGLALMELYRQAKVNPFSGLLFLLVQLPILIALYQVFWRGLQPEQLDNFLYSFVPRTGNLTFSFLGLIPLEQGNFILALIGGLSQYWQSKMVIPKTQNKKATQKAAKASGPDFGSMMQKQMLYFFPGLTFILLLQFPAAIGLYWVSSNIFSIAQQYLFLKNNGRTKPTTN